MCLAMSAKTLWNWDAFFDYMDQYMQEVYVTGIYRQWTAFQRDMWDEYREDYGTIYTAGNQPTTDEETPASAIVPISFRRRTQ